MAEEEIDWSLTTYEGNRRRQHEEFRALSFREKLTIIEDMGDVVARFQSRRPSSGQAAPGDEPIRRSHRERQS